MTSMRLRIRSAQAAELARLERIGLVSLEQVVRERARLGGACMMAVLVDDEEDVQGRVIGLAGAIELPESMARGQA
ncbi:MAG: hypothetical protein ACYDHX_07940 [Methanothrix sp.]